jgi:hypothetical protein
MQQHIEVEYLELLNAHVAKFISVKGNSRSQSMCVEGNKVVQPTNKCQNVTPSVISNFFGSKTIYKKQDEIWNLLLEGLVLLIGKGFFPLSSCENIWMCKLVLNLDFMLVFPFQTTSSLKISFLPWLFNVWIFISNSNLMLYS